MEHAGTWIYPSVDAYPKRQYQFEIAKSAILQNTLVSLPTGLGKTLIAAVVLYNYYRWFPTGKILFLAPTLPLVDQQVQACYEIMGIPATDTALLTGKIPATQRAVVWNEKRVFFCTPQTVQKDLENNRCDASKVVCVVLDEAHKSTGDYAYCKVIAHLEKAGAKFRILGLSATPGTSIKAIQLVVDILRINCIEARSDADPDVKQYIHDRQTEVVVVKQITAVTKPVERRLDGMIAPILEALRQRHALPSRLIGNATVTSYCLLTARESYNKRPEHQRDHITLGYFAAGMRLIQIRSDLHQLGIGSVRNKLHQLRQERPRGYLATLVKSPDFQLLWAAVDQISCDPSDFGNNTVQDKLKNNPKLEKLREILTEHFERARACGTLSSTRAIVFSQFRTSVSEIVSVLNEYQPLIRARHFVGQAKSQRKQQQEPSSGSSEGLLLQPQAKATTTTTSVEGMRQDEQKAVIAEFRNGIHNALVCTSIGEEGCKFDRRGTCIVSVYNLMYSVCIQD